MKKAIIGHCACPICDHADAEVKEDKNGCAFIFCPDCNTQVFTRDSRRDAMLRKKMRPVAVTVTEPEKKAPPTVPVTEPKSQPVAPPKAPPVPKPQPKPKNPPAADPVPNPPKKKSSWFQPLLAQGGK